MKLICDCGAIVDFVEDEDGSSYTEDEGWYRMAKGDIEIHGEHDQVFFHCEKCGTDTWIFT